MRPIDYRNETFDRLRGEMHGLRETIYRAWLAHGPCTTRELAERAGLDILTLRPRTTELVQIGAVTVDESRTEPGQGVYRARPVDEWRAWVEGRRACLAPVEQQQLL